MLFIWQTKEKFALKNITNTRISFNPKDCWMAEMMFRVQKLLQSEYDDFKEEILIENPFTEVTDDGVGKQQLYIGEIFSYEKWGVY